MAIDARNLKPSQLCRLLNSTPLGDVITERQLHRHRTRAGFRIGDGPTVDVLNYVAWLVEQVHAPKEDPEAANYEAIKEAARARAAALSRSGRELGKHKDPVDPARRDACLADPELFLKTYFPQAFPLRFSRDHRDVIATIDRVMRVGGLFALAMPRGSGKTAISVRMAILALVGGLRRFVALVGATEDAAKRIIRTIKTELTHNQLLYDDFPAELHGIPQLQGDNRLSIGQLYEGKRTSIELSVSHIIFPTIPGSRCSGSIITACGITGNLRGQFHTLPDGTILRPDMAILDDPQTKESADSSAQTQERLEIVEGDVLGLAGPNVSIATVMPCTVIAKDDLTERLLEKPLWNGRRTKTLDSFPDNMALWDEYFQIRAEGLRVDRSSDRGMAFYRENQAALEAGAEASWPDRILEGDVSAVQSAMHLWNRSPGAFAAEYQNDPIDPSASEDRPTFRGLASKTTQLKRGVVPTGSTKITAGIDVQQRLLYYAVVAWKDDFSGSLIDYGAFPRQGRAYYRLAEASPTLQSISGIKETEGAIRWGLEHLCGDLDRDWPMESGGGVLRMDRDLVDVGWGEMSDVVYEFLRRTKHKTLAPAKGEGITAGKRPMDESAKKTGETLGLQWKVTSADGHRHMRRVIHDTNWWKTFVAARCSAPAGNPGSMSIFGANEEQHRLLVDHLAAEAPEKTFGNGRVVWEWHWKPGEDNHLLDCLVMAAVAASISGVTLDVLRSEAKVVKRLKLSALQASKR